MFTKIILDNLLSRNRFDAVEVKYWDGDVRSYGVGKPFIKLQLHTEKAARNILRHPSLGMGEGYINGTISIDGNPGEILRLSSSTANFGFPTILEKIASPRTPNTKKLQARHIQHHYDVGNDFYRLWLDKSLTYSCAYFRDPTDSIELAQEQKITHILRKLQLKSEHSLLDIGCGWGSLLITAAKKYGVTGLGITLSKEQLNGAREHAKAAGVDKLVKFRLLNFQDLAKEETVYDRIVSVGMFEHVGRYNQSRYYAAVAKMLAVDGVSVLHTISQQFTRPMDLFIDRYIFPGSYIPGVSQVTAELANHGLYLIDYENLRLHYSLTLAAWLQRFEDKRETIIAMFDEQFYRMWYFYLSCTEASFRYGATELSQFVFTKGINNKIALTRQHLYIDE